MFILNNYWYFFRLHSRFVGVDSPKITHPNSHPWIYSTIGFPNKRINGGHQKEKKSSKKCS
jgi:hypothetical protein